MSENFKNYLLSHFTEYQIPALKRTTLYLLINYDEKGRTLDENSLEAGHHRHLLGLGLKLGIFDVEYTCCFGLSPEGRELAKKMKKELTPEEIESFKREYQRLKT
jgi:hypothetical protein